MKSKLKNIHFFVNKIGVSISFYHAKTKPESAHGMIYYTHFSKYRLSKIIQISVNNTPHWWKNNEKHKNNSQSFFKCY